MPTVNGITYRNKLGLSDGLTRHYEQACRASSHVANDSYAQAIEAQWASDPTRIPAANWGNTLTNPQVGQTGDASYASLDFIDWYMFQLKYLGVGWYREWGASPRYLYDLELQSQSSPITVLEVNDWSALDRIVDRCEEYGIQLVLTIPWPWSYGWGISFPWIDQGPKDFQNVLDNWMIPMATFFADRYSTRTDFVQIDPANEPFIMSGYGQGNYILGAEHAALQVAIYDAVKAVAPNMRVNLACTLYSGIDAVLAGLNSLSRMDAFDSHVITHLYPPAVEGQETTSPFWPTVDVPYYLAALASYNRTDVQIRIDEFQGSGATVGEVPFTQGELDTKGWALSTAFSQVNSLSGCDGICLWRLLTYKADGNNFGFDCGSTWEAPCIGFTQTFPPSDYSQIWTYMRSLDLYPYPFTQANRVAGTYGPLTTITLSEYLTDLEQPVAKLYSWDNPTPATTYTTPFGVQTGTLYFRGVDAGANEEEVVNSIEFILDDTPPTTSCNLSPGEYQYGTQITFSEVGTDSSQPVSIYYDWGVNPPTQLYTGNLVTVDRSGTLYFRGVDFLGNQETVNSVALTVLTSPLYGLGGGNFQIIGKDGALIPFNVKE